MRMAMESPWILQCATGRTVRLTARNPSITCNATASNLERNHRLILCSDYSKSVTKLPTRVNGLRYVQQTAPREGKTCRIKYLELVAGGGFEPPTFGL